MQEVAGDVKSQEIIAREVTTFMTNIGSVRVSYRAGVRGMTQHQRGSQRSVLVLVHL